MSLSTLLVAMTEQGIELHLDSDRLRYRSKGRPSTATLAEISLRKDVLRRLLARAEQPSRSFPLTVTQRQLWGLARVWSDGRGQKAYNEAIVLRVAGTVSATALQRAYEEIVERHPALRTEIEPGGQMQTITPYAAAKIVDLGCFTAGEQRNVLARIERELATQHRLDLAPVPRLLLAQVGADAVIALTSHHIVCDGMALALLLRELGHRYAAQARNMSLPLEPSVSHERYVEVRAQSRSSPRADIDRAHWIGRLNQLSSVATPTVSRTYGGARIAMTLPYAWSDLLNAATTLRVTPFALALAVFARAVGEVDGNPTPLALISLDTRPYTDCDDVVGYCSEVYPVVLAHAHRTWAASSRTACRALFEVLSHTSCSLADLLAADPSIAITSSFTATYLDLHEANRFGELPAKVLFTQPPYRDAPLTLNLHRMPEDRVVVCCDYCVDYLDQRHVQDILARVMSNFADVIDSSARK
jgi:Condensation domain